MDKLNREKAKFIADTVSMKDKIDMIIFEYNLGVDDFQGFKTKVEKLVEEIKEKINLYDSEQLNK